MSVFEFRNRFYNAVFGLKIIKWDLPIEMAKLLFTISYVN